MGFGRTCTIAATCLLGLAFNLGAVALSLQYWESTECGGKHYNSGLFAGILCDDTVWVDGVCVCGSTDGQVL